jgi:hypothetical protein
VYRNTHRNVQIISADEDFEPEIVNLGSSGEEDEENTADEDDPLLWETSTNPSDYIFIRPSFMRVEDDANHTSGSIPISDLFSLRRPQSRRRSRELDDSLETSTQDLDNTGTDPMEISSSIDSDEAEQIASMDRFAPNSNEQASGMRHSPGQGEKEDSGKHDDELTNTVAVALIAVKELIQSEGISTDNEEVFEEQNDVETQPEFSDQIEEAEEDNAEMDVDAGKSANEDLVQQMVEEEYECPRIDIDKGNHGEEKLWQHLSESDIESEILVMVDLDESQSDDDDGDDRQFENNASHATPTPLCQGRGDGNDQISNHSVSIEMLNDVPDHKSSHQWTPVPHKKHQVKARMNTPDSDEEDAFEKLEHTCKSFASLNETGRSSLLRLSASAGRLHGNGSLALEFSFD